MAVKSKEFKTKSEASKFIPALKKLFPNAAVLVNEYRSKDNKPAFKIHIFE